MCCGNLPRFILPEVRPEAAPASSEASGQPAEPTCPNCRAVVAPHYTWCPMCGTALRPYPCAYCGQMISPEETHCGHCGAPARATAPGSGGRSSLAV
jgi:predicted amidophosphoribosyltransferase